MLEAFDRYAPVTDLAALREISQKPLRKGMRVNLRKSTIKKFEQWAKSEGWQIDPVPWCPEAYTVERDDRSTPLGKDLLHLLGHTYIQEPASMLPVALLDPQPGEKVLDMCSAPGSKTTQMAARMQGRGVIVASDVQDKRLWSLASNLQRCGVTNVVVISKVGQWFAKHMTGRFDRILVDAPCTAQGTCRKDPTALKYCGDENIAKMARLQTQILESAIHALRIGGRIVYSTCTLTWEENEEVIRTILNKFGDQISVLDEGVIDVSEDAKSALAKAREDSERMQKYRSIGPFPAFRLWPQTFDTEGFFACVIEKKAPTREAERMEFVRLKEAMIQGATMKRICSDLRDWYGTDFLEEDDVLFESPSQMFVTTKDVMKFKLPVRNTLLGLPYGKRTKGLTRTSHEIATLRGDRAEKQIVDISGEELSSLLTGENLKDVRYSCESGDALLRANINDQSLMIGRGLLKEGDILNRLPRDIVRMHT